MKISLGNLIKNKYTINIWFKKNVDFDELIYIYYILKKLK
jgi:hypothetical protein